MKNQWSKKLILVKDEQNWQALSQSNQENDREEQSK
jgi:hypothetical protein